MRQNNKIIGYRGRAKEKKRTKVSVPLVFVFVALAFFAYYLASPLALVEQVNIIGNEHLQSADILQVAGLNPGMHMWRLKTAASRDKLMENPWVESARIKREFPNSILIIIQERKGMAIVSGENGNWVVAQDGMALAENQGFSLPWLTGLELEPQLSPGKQVQGKNVQLALGWASAFQSLAGQISEINFSNPGLISVFTTDGYKALFNPTPVTEEKVQDFTILMEELRRNQQKGIMDFRGLRGRGVFIPWPGKIPDE